MRVYVCWDSNAHHPILGDHPCGIAYHAVVDAGYDPELVKAYGWTKLPRFLNSTRGRNEVRELTGGSDEVRILELDEGEVIAGSAEIVAWAEANPAPAPN